ncbi:Piso0_002028 [Millerozyma farinosa CBS 7064]|uniref:Piso0_002028 protein n=1 Tax=Pichia sorbitophila (strain ATCC MYA-4447 / BCRC 22081 / CBS 7064 / NBRC 10061 / NRRL Y-12695) TaxID=559304 RepID=G8YMC2_PICSO|nr:Piso0_002028 [Millerozyma farinosa CBS 7064]
MVNNHASKTQLTVKLVATVFAISLGAFQFGYHMAELNSPESIITCQRNQPTTTPYKQTWFGSHGFKKCIPLDPQEFGLITSIFSIGGLLGSFSVSNIADKYGRKTTSLLHCVFFFLGSTLNGLGNTYQSLLVGRFVAGLGAGFALVASPIFINEIAPKEYKGLLGTMSQLSTNVGILFTQLLSLSWSNNNQWRLLLLMGSALACINFACLLCYVDESPVWLSSKGLKHDAFKVLHGLRGGEYSTSMNEVRSWGYAPVQESEDASLLEGQMAGPASTRRPTVVEDRSVSLVTYLKSSEFNNSKLVSTGILVLQQFCGINSIIFYGVSVLVKIFPQHAILVNCLITVVNVTVTTFSAALIDQLGRRPLLLASTAFMGFSSIIMAIGILNTNSLLSVLGTFSYVMFFAIGIGPIPFLLVSEVTQPEAKASAQSWGITMNWLATFIVGFIFPVLKNSRLGGGVYFIFAFMCFFSSVFVKAFVPETKGTSSYEEVWHE